MGTMDERQPCLVQWIVDTRPLWPVPRQAKVRDEVRAFGVAASRALSLLPEPEQASVLKYFHVRDAKASLVSHLLKHLVVSRYCRVPWLESTISRDKNGKPCYIPSAPSTDDVRIDFNISHQDGIVTLVAAVGFEADSRVEVGTDVVCVNERAEQDYETVAKEGFFSWMDTYAQVFSASDIQRLKILPVPIKGRFTLAQLDSSKLSEISTCQRRNQEIAVSIKTADGGAETIKLSSSEIIDAKIRRFYALWSLREAYVKMTGEALLAPWLGELEISDLNNAPCAKEGIMADDSLEPGETYTTFTIHFKGARVTNVRMALTALGNHFMVTAAVRCENPERSKSPEIGSWEELDVEKDILAHAEASL